MKIRNFIREKINHILRAWWKTHTIIVFFLFLYTIVIYKLFDYTVFDYDFYINLANSQQIWKFTVPVNRWTIYSSIERWDESAERLSVLWTSVNFYDLAIDPKMTWDKSKLKTFLVDIVYDEICKNKSKKVCRENLLKYLRKIEIEDFEFDESFIKWLLSENIAKKTSKTKLESVFLWNDFKKEQLNELKNLSMRWVYIRNNSIFVNPEEFSHRDEDIRDISKILLINKERLKYIIRKRDLRYVPIINKLSIDSYEKLKEFKDEEEWALKRWIIDKESSISTFLILSPRPTRYYPEWEIASQVIWFVDGEWIWHYGIEWYFNDILKWNNWQIISKKDIQWRIIDPISLNREDLIWRWVEITTTIDRNIQEKVEKILASWVKRYRANKWTIVVTEPKTWRVIAMANYPTYDLNNYSDVYELEKIKNSDYENPWVDLLWYPIFVEDSLEWVKNYYDNKEIYLRKATLEELSDRTLVKYKYKNDFWAGVYKNDAISSLYEPGSIIKSITVAIWLDTWEISKYSKYNDTWVVRVWEYKIYNDDQEKCMWYNTFWHALNFSCNVWMIRIFQRLWRALSHQYFEDFWFSELTWVSLEWEVFSKMEPWQKISRASFFTRSYGLWISVTPLQMATAYNVLANGWIYVKPKIIEKIVYPDWVEQVFNTEEKRRVIKESTSKLITKMLYNWAELWFAKTGRVEWYSIAWKTWTSQINYRWKYKTWPGWTNASYAWYGPVEDPKFVIVVKLERPRTNIYGSRTAWVMFSEVASYLFDYFEIPKK